MKFWFALIFLWTAIKSSRESCQTLYLKGKPYFSFRQIDGNYVHCEDVTFTSNFSTEIKPLLVNIGRNMNKWVEVNNTNSPEIATGAFTNLSIVDLRINGAKVHVIQPGAFGNLPLLTNLSLKNNRIQEVTGSYFNNLTKLVTLDLSFNNILTVDQDSFRNLTNLEKLFLQNNLISDFPSNLFKNLIKIKFLDLSFNKLIELDGNLFINLTDLTSLWLNNNDIKDLNKNLFVNNPKLWGLYVNNNFFTKLNELQFNSRQMSWLNVSYNVIQSITFLKFVDIRYLDLRNNGISTLNPKWFENLAVRYLYLDDNNIGLSSLNPETFSNLSTVEMISLHNNQISKIVPNLFEENVNLEQLILSKNYLKYLNSSSLPRSLRTLNLNSNYFNDFMNLSNFVNLQILDMSSNNLTRITFHSLQGMPALVRLLLQNNKISKLDLGCFRDLAKLDTLNLSNNNISDLGIGVFAKLTVLRTLDVSHNKLFTINEGVFHSTRGLRSLNLSYNNFSYVNVKNTLSHLTWLRDIDVVGNNWPCSFLRSLFGERRILNIVEGHETNVTNINGIACIDDSEEEVQDLNKLYSETSDRTMDKINNTNVLLVLILLVLIALVIVITVRSDFVKNRISRLAPRKTEQELQLLT